MKQKLVAKTFLVVVTDDEGFKAKASDITNGLRYTFNFGLRLQIPGVNVKSVKLYNPPVKKRLTKKKR